MFKRLLGKVFGPMDPVGGAVIAAQGPSLRTVSTPSSSFRSASTGQNNGASSHALKSNALKRQGTVNASLSPSGNAQASEVKTAPPLSVEDQFETDFYHFLFGESELNLPVDELSACIAEKIQKLLLSPKAILKSLPILPASLTEIIKQTQHDEFDADVIVELLKQEPIIAAKVIQLANSAFYNRSGKEITELKGAFMLLGAKGLYEGVLQGFLSQLTAQHAIYFKQYGEKVWQHSLSISEIARELAANSEQKELASFASLTGLLSNLGNIIIYQLMIEAFSVVHPDMQPGSAAFTRLLRNNAKKLTYHIAKFWEFPESIFLALCIQTKLHSSTLLKPCFEKSPIACFVYEARIISEIKMRCASPKFIREDVNIAYTTLLYTKESKAYLKQHFGEYLS